MAHWLVRTCWKPWLGITTFLFSGVVLAALPSRANETKESARLTLQAENATLGDVCAALSSLSGDQYICDAKSSNLRLTLMGSFEADPLRQAMSDVLGIEWKTEAVGAKAKYSASISRANSLREAGLVEAFDRSFETGIARVIRAAGQAKPSEAEFGKQFTSLLRYPQYRAAARLLGTLPQADRRAAAQGRMVSTPIERLPAEAKDLASELLTADYPDGSPAPPISQHGLMVQVRRPSGLLTSRNPSLQVGVINAEGLGLLKGLTLSFEGEGCEDSRQRMPVDPAVPENLPAVRQLTVSLSAGEHVPYPQALREISGVTGFGIVSDGYLSDESVINSRIPLPTRPLPAFLDALGSRVYAQWGARSNCLTFRRCDWALRRQSQIPASQLRGWHAEMVRTGSLTLDLLTDLRRIPQQQRDLLNFVEGETNPSYAMTEFQVRQHDRLLEFWGGLPSSLRTRAITKGLASNDVPVRLHPQWNGLAIQSGLGEAVPGPGVLRGKLKLEINPEEVSYSFYGPGNVEVWKKALPLTLAKAALARLQREAVQREEFRKSGILRQR